MTRLLACFGIATALVALVTAVIVHSNHAPRPIEGAVFIDRGVLCLDPACTDPHQVTLPYQLPRNGTVDLTQATLTVTLDPALTAASESPWLLIPSVRRQVNLRENGVQTHGTEPITGWGALSEDNRPVLLPLRVGTTELALTHIFAGQEGATVYPMHIGPLTTLQPAFRIRFGATWGVGLVSLVFMGLSFIMASVMALGRPRDSIYRWLAVSNAAAVLVGVQYAFPQDPLPYALWMPLYTWAAQFYVLTLFKFILRFLDLSYPRLEAAHMVIVLVGLVALFIVPDRAVTALAAFTCAVSIFWALMILTVFLRYRSFTSTRSFVVLYFLLTCALAIAVHDYLLLFSDVMMLPTSAGQALPGVMMLGTIWLIVSQLLRTITNFEALNANLQHEVDAKALELTENARALARAETERALENQRARMMLELHDGVGGQIVNTVAYLEQSDHPDPVLISSLEDMLRDVGIMMDGYATIDAPVDVLLGGLRNRYEALLDKNGIAFDWQVGAGGGVPRLEPEETLDFLRIVQESITNTVKHSHATRITVWTSPTSVRVSDDGCANAPVPEAAWSTGRGLGNMERRAKAIRARFSFDRGPKGAEVRLTWDAQ